MNDGLEHYEKRGGKWQRYEQSTPIPQVQVPRVTVPIVTPRPLPELQPGETMMRREYRQKTGADLVPALGWAATLGIALGALSGLLTESIQFGIAFGLGTFTVAFLAASFPTVWQDGSSVVTLLENVTHLDLNRDGKVGETPVIRVVGELQGQGTSRHTYVDLPLTQVTKWQTFCQDVVAGHCLFSGNAAEDHGVDRAAFDQVVQNWASEDDRIALVDPASVGQRLTLELTTQGHQMVSLYARLSPTQVRDLLSPYTGDR